MNKPAEAKLKSTDAKQRDWFTIVTQIHSNYCDVFFRYNFRETVPDSMDTLRNRSCTLLIKGQTMKRHKNKKKILIFLWLKKS